MDNLNLVFEGMVRENHKSQLRREKLAKDKARCNKIQNVKETALGILFWIIIFGAYALASFLGA